MVAIPLAVQLYSVRDLADRDLDGALDRLVDCGYTAVEPFDLHGVSAAAFGRSLRERSLSVVAFHLPPGDGPAVERSLESLAEWGTRRVVVPWWDPAALFTAEDVERLAESLNRFREQVARWDMELGYHNHWWEFARCLEGSTLHERLFAQLHPAIFAEIDVYWVAVAGLDPAAVLRSLGPRVKLVHLKDGPADGEESLMTALGEGALDLPSILAASAGVEARVVEIDACAGDVFAALARSREYVHRLSLA